MSAAARPLVQVYDNQGKVVGQSTLPTVLVSPIRPDIVQFVHTNMNKNRRQAYAVYQMAGHQTAAASWGTGRAVSRIPRVPGGGTHRAGQGAFGNMCRGGRMFAPTRTWRKWHRKINVNQRRYATVSALAASALPAIVMARGHSINNVTEVPLVLSDKACDIQKTRQAVALLQSVNAYDDVLRAKASRQIRSGKGKLRNRRYVQRRGPLIVYDGPKSFTHAFRNLPGVELCNVSRLNLLQLAPGGHLGRFVIWTQSAFERLDSLYGDYNKPSAEKTGYRLPRSKMSNSDLTRIINSDEIQAVLRPAAEKATFRPRRKNPFKNTPFLVKLNPYAEEHKKQATAACAKKRPSSTKQSRKENRDVKNKRKAFYTTLTASTGYVHKKIAN